MFSQPILFIIEFLLNKSLKVFLQCIAAPIRLFFRHKQFIPQFQGLLLSASLHLSASSMKIAWLEGATFPKVTLTFGCSLNSIFDQYGKLNYLTQKNNGNSSQFWNMHRFIWDSHWNCITLNFLPKHDFLLPIHRIAL